MVACEICGREYSRRDHVKRHQKTAHPTAEDLRELHEKFKCKICQKSFIDNNTLKRHILKVHNKRYKCRAPGCFQRFGKLAPLRKHLCGKHSQLDYTLMQKLFLECLPGTPEHEAAWSVPSPISMTMTVGQSDGGDSSDSPDVYRCYFPDCEQLFPNYPMLRNHWKRHLKPFKCPACPEMEFYSYRALVDHRRERHQACPICKVVPAQGHMQSHLRTHFKAPAIPPEVFFACPDCDYSCLKPDLLDHHRKTAHRSNGSSNSGDQRSYDSPNGSLNGSPNGSDGALNGSDGALNGSPDGSLNGSDGSPDGSLNGSPSVTGSTPDSLNSTSGSFNGSTSGSFNGSTPGSFNGSTPGSFNGSTPGSLNGSFRNGPLPLFILEEDSGSELSDEAPPSTGFDVRQERVEESAPAFDGLRGRFKMDVSIEPDCLLCESKVDVDNGRDLHVTLKKPKFC